METFFASPEMQICRSFREAYAGQGSMVLRRLTAPDLVQEFARSAERGLLSWPRRLESRFLYDAQGSELFDMITQQPEYYLTRTETAILARHAARIRELAGPATLVEFGSGSSVKTDLLLDAWLARAPGACYVPLEISESALVGACDAIAVKHPQARVVGVNVDFHEAFPLLSLLSPALVLFLGSSIGNFAPTEMFHFLSRMADSMSPGDFFLLGIDLVKAPAQLEAAYNDAAGITARFTRNIFSRMNRELGCSIDVEAIEHVAQFEAEREQVVTCARFTRSQSLFLVPVGRHVSIYEGETVQTEISRKFRLEHFVPYLQSFGFISEATFTDDNEWFALLLLRRGPRY